MDGYPAIAPGFRNCRIVLLALAHGVDGSEATEQFMVRMYQNLPPDLQMIFPFARGSTEIRAEFRPILTRLAAVLRANPSLRLLAIGHADGTGTPEF